MLESKLKEYAEQLGFDRCGIAPAVTADGFERMHDWLERGYAGEMSYMDRQAEARRHPSSILADVKSVIMLGMVYSATTDSSETPSGSSKTGRVARYARGPDYHDVLWKKQN